MKKIIAGAAALASTVVFAASVSAHVVVSPKEVGVGKFQTFSIGVPVEHDEPTVGLRLVLPEGLNYVTPNVKPGWTVTVKQQPTGNKVKDHRGAEVDETKPTEIVWAGGTIPAGQRDDFLFSAQVPATAGTIQWKAYQTYADGSVVSWEISKDQQQPQKDGKNDYSQFGPASETKIVDDLATPSPTSILVEDADDAKESSRNSKVAIGISVISLLVAAFAVARKS